MAKTYNSDSIVALEKTDQVRKKPAVIFGSKDVNGAKQALFEILSNSIDEAREGYGDKIEFTIHKDNSVTVKDYGRGVPMAMNRKEGKYAYDLVFNQLYAGGKYDNSDYSYSLGTNGLGATSTNYASKWFKVESCRDNKKYTVEFEEGVQKGKLQKEHYTGNTGTTISFLLDLEVFDDINVDKNEILSVIQEQAIVNSGVTFIFKDERDKTKEELCYPEGILGYAKEMANNDNLTDPINFTFEGSGKDRADKPNYKVKGEIVIIFNNKSNEALYFHNSSPLSYGGSPRRAKEKAFTEFFKQELKKTNANRAKEIEFEDIQDSMVFISNTFSTETSYENQTKKAINNKFIEDFLTQQITKHLKSWAKENPMELEKVTNQISINIQSRKSASAQKLATKQKLTSKLKIDDKIKNFTDCRSKKPEERELYISEGLSAQGSLKTARNAEFQALLPIRGKLLNTLKTDYGTIFKNELIMDIMKLVGTGVEMKAGKSSKLGNFDIDNLRFNKIIIACFTGDTKIKSLDGNSYSFNELIENNVEELWVYSKDNQGNIVPALAKNIRQTGITNRIVNITLDNGETISCTPDHLFLQSNGKYIRADQLKTNTSLMPLHTKIDNTGHEMYYDELTSKWIYTHKMVAENIYHKEKKQAEFRLQNEDHKLNQNNIVVHHKNILDKNNKLNNTPENLEWLTNKEHFIKHGESGYTAYNVSQKHRDRVKELHKNGHYDKTHFGNNGYNELGIHSDRIKEHWKNGTYENNETFTTNGYNYSQKHHDVVSKTNSSQIHIDSVNKSRILKSIKFLILNGLEFNEYYYNLYRHFSANKYENILSVFDSYEQAYNEALNVEFDLSNYNFAYDYVNYDNNAKQRKQIGNVIHSIISSGDEFTETTYEAIRGERAVKYENILNWFDSYESALEYGKTYNHTVAKVEIMDTNDTPVYCLEVPNYHNFLLDSGIFVKNCDEDIDGWHIQCLLLTMFYKLTPKLIENGHIYILQTPLYEINIKGEKDTKFAFTDEEMIQITKDKSCKVSRNKGLGEINAEVFSQFMEPETRRLKQITIDDAKEAKEMLELFMGNDSSIRKDFITEHSKEYDDLDLE